MNDKALTVGQNYDAWVEELGKRYRQSQVRAAVKVNEDLIMFYFCLGHDIVERNMENTYGSGFYSSLSRDLQRQLPNATGLSENNIRYAKRCYCLYNKAIENLPQLVENFDKEKTPQIVALLNDDVSVHIMSDLCHIPWGHHRAIIDKVKVMPMRLYFIYERH